jgi:hypothetical protein
MSERSERNDKHGSVLGCGAADRHLSADAATVELTSFVREAL